MPFIIAAVMAAPLSVAFYFGFIRRQGGVRKLEDPTLFIRRGHVAHLAPFRATAAPVRAIASAPVPPAVDRDDTVGLIYEPPKVVRR